MDDPTVTTEAPELAVDEVNAIADEDIENTATAQRFYTANYGPTCYHIPGQCK
jgi:hypothetical protein